MIYVFVAIAFTIGWIVGHISGIEKGWQEAELVSSWKDDADELTELDDEP